MKEVSEQLEMGGCSKETLSESDEIGDMKNSVGMNVMQLAAEEPEEAVHEIVEGKPKPPLRSILSTRRAHRCGAPEGLHWMEAGPSDLSTSGAGPCTPEPPPP